MFFLRFFVALQLFKPESKGNSRHIVLVEIPDGPDWFIRAEIWADDKNGPASAISTFFYPDVGLSEDLPGTNTPLTISELFAK